MNIGHQEDWSIFDHWGQQEQILFTEEKCPIKFKDLIIQEADISLYIGHGLMMFIVWGNN